MCVSGVQCVWVCAVCVGVCVSGVQCVVSGVHWG